MPLETRKGCIGRSRSNSFPCTPTQYLAALRCLRPSLQRRFFFGIAHLCIEAIEAVGLEQVGKCLEVHVERHIVSLARTLHTAIDELHKLTDVALIELAHIFACGELTIAPMVTRQGYSRPPTFNFCSCFIYLIYICYLI